MPDDLVECVARGIDMFDCVLPTRNARNGQLLTRDGVLNIRNARYAEDDRPPDADCGCYTCRPPFSAAYLRHLATVGEMLGGDAQHHCTISSFTLTPCGASERLLSLGPLRTFRQAFHQTFSRASLTS